MIGWNFILTVSCLRKYLIKALLFLSIIAFLTTTAATVVTNIILASSKNTILEAANKYFPQKISIGKVFYLPPVFIIIKDASILEADSTQKQIISVPEIRIGLSFVELITRRRASVSAVSLYGPKMDYSRICAFVKDNFEKLADFMKHTPRKDINISIKEAKLELAGNDNGARYATANLFLRMRGRSVFAKVSLSKDSPNFIVSMPLRCVFKGVMTDGGISIENLEFIRENLYAKFWGDFINNILQLNGFGFMNTSFQGSGYGVSASDALKKIKNALSARTLRLTADDLAGINLYVLDIGCRINLTLPKVQIEGMSFFLNNHPVSLRGSVIFSRPFAFDLAVFSNRTAEGSALSENFKRVDLRLKGVLESSMFKGNCMLSLAFRERKKLNSALERVRLGLKDLTLHFSEQAPLKMSLEKLSLFCLEGDNSYRVFLDNLNASLYLRDKKTKFIEFSSLFYDGSLRGWGRLDLGKIPVRFSSAFRLRNVNASGLGGLLIHLSKVYGRLNGQGYFSSYPLPSLRGGIVVKSGYLRDFEFFRWFAETFNLPKLKNINFSKFSSNFMANPEGSGLSRIKLEAQDVNLSGYFRLSADDLVSSKLSLSLSRELLKESPKFSPLLKLSNSGLDSLSFNFQLSGILHAMNFQWLDSDLKKDVQGAIPGFVERIIERGVENIMESNQ